MPRSLGEFENWLRSAGWRRGAGGNYYFPEGHPHLHLGPTFLAYSWRVERNGLTENRSIRMLVDNDLHDFGLGLDAVDADYRDEPELRARMLREARAVAVTVFAYRRDAVDSL